MTEMTEQLNNLRMLVGDAMQEVGKDGLAAMVSACQPAVDYAISEGLIIDRGFEFIVDSSFLQLLSYCAETDTKLAADLAGWASGVVMV